MLAPDSLDGVAQSGVVGFVADNAGLEPGDRGAAFVREARQRLMIVHEHGEFALRIVEAPFKVRVQLMADSDLGLRGRQFRAQRGEPVGATIAFRAGFRQYRLQRSNTHGPSAKFGEVARMAVGQLLGALFDAAMLEREFSPQLVALRDNFIHG